MRHGIALDKEVTVILSQSDETQPLCGIYFNLHSPYKKESLARTEQPRLGKKNQAHQMIFTVGARYRRHAPPRKSRPPQ